MTHWVRPDRLDRLTASPGTRPTSVPASPAAVAEALRKVLVTGRLRRVPRNPQHRDIVLGLLCRGLRRRHPYTETDINGCLVDALAAMSAEVDHVTCRRYLVDLGFVRRDRSGRRYLLNFPRLEAALSGEAMRYADRLVHEALEAGRRRAGVRAQQPDNQDGASS